jgi:fermentation-respiration switch protein FrsA (DUF1100 family)
MRVTIVEPGGFRTDLAGSSTELREGRPEFDAAVVAPVRFQSDYDGRQPGDPIKAAGELPYIASLSEPPLRLLFGSDAFSAAEKHTMQILATRRRVEGSQHLDRPLLLARGDESSAVHGKGNDDLSTRFT